MHPITIRILVATFAAAALLSAQRASADMYTATQAYDKGDFAGAFQQFKDLAELGQPTAQLCRPSALARRPVEILAGQ